LVMYAEDWIYAPAVTKTVEILKATKDKILFMKAEESHSGSHAAHAAQWSMTGGGSVIRMGCHPLSTVLYLKQVEGNSRGERIAVTGVIADVGNVAASLSPQDRPFINANPVDVEDWGMLTLTFSGRHQKHGFLRRHDHGWGAQRPSGGSPAPIWPWPMRLRRSTTPPIGRPRRGGGSRCSSHRRV